MRLKAERRTKIAEAMSINAIALDVKWSSSDTYAARTRRPMISEMKPNWVMNLRIIWDLTVEIKVNWLASIRSTKNTNIPKVSKWVCWKSWTSLYAKVTDSFEWIMRVKEVEYGTD